MRTNHSTIRVYRRTKPPIACEGAMHVRGSPVPVMPLRRMRVLSNTASSYYRHYLHHLPRCTIVTDAPKFYIRVFFFENNAALGDGQFQLLHLKRQPQPHHGRVRDGCQPHRRPRSHSAGGKSQAERDRPRQPTEEVGP